MRYVRDLTGRFPERPHYEQNELDSECERIIASFTQQGGGSVAYPVATDVLTRLIERDAEDLDLYADLTHEGPDVQAVTEFRRGHKPRVRIAADLSEAGREHRLRTTLTHEYGHVKFHGYLFEMRAQTMTLPRVRAEEEVQRCRRQNILDAPQTDWMEWQAGYICGSLLMPKTAITKLVSDYVARQGAWGRIAVDSPQGLQLQQAVSEVFDVSREAARIRLLKLGLASSHGRGSTLL